MAKPSSIPRKAIRANHPPRLPSSPLRAHTSALPPQDVITASNHSHAKDYEDSRVVTRELGEDDDDDDFNPFTSHKSNKFSASAALAAHKSQKSQQPADSSLWLFGDDGPADLTNIIQGVSAPWGMATSDGEIDSPSRSENRRKKNLSKNLKDFLAAPLSPPKTGVLSPTNGLASRLLSPTHKLNRQSSLRNNLRKPLSSRGVSPLNFAANPSTSTGPIACATGQSTKSNATTSNLKQANPQDCLPSTTTCQSPGARDASRCHSAQPTEASVKPFPPSAMKKLRDASVDPPKSTKKTRFINLDESVDRNPSSSLDKLPRLAAPNAISDVDLDDASHHIRPLTPTLNAAFVSVPQKATAELPCIPTISSLTNTHCSTSESTKCAPPTEAINLLNSSPIHVQPPFLSPGRTLASRLQPSQPRSPSIRAFSAESSSDQPAIDKPSQKNKAQSLPISSFKRLTRANSTDSRVFQTIQTAPVVNLKRTSSIPHADYLKPSRVIRDLTSIAGASEGDSPVLQVGQSLAKLPDKLSQSSRGMIEPQTNPITHIEIRSDQSEFSADENNCDSQLAPDTHKLESFKRQKVLNSRRSSSSLSENEEVQVVKSTDNLQDGSRNSKLRSRRTTNRVHVSEKVGPRLSALIELPTPNSTVEAIGLGDIEEIAVGSSNISIICQNAGVPQFSTPHSAGPVRLPLPPDTHQLLASRPRRSCRKSLVKPSPSNLAASPSTFDIQASPPHLTPSPLHSSSKTLPSHNTAIQILPENTAIVSANVVDSLQVTTLKPASNSSTPTPLALSLNSNDSTNTASSTIATDKQNSRTIPVPPPKNEPKSVDGVNNRSSSIANETHPRVSKKRSRVQVQAPDSLAIINTARTRSRERCNSTEPTDPPAPSQCRQSLQGSGKIVAEILTSQQPDNQCQPNAAAVTQASDVARGKRPSIPDDNRASATISKRPRVPPTSTMEHARVPDNLSRSKPLQPRSRSTSQAVRKTSSSKAISGAISTAQIRAPQKSGESSGNPPANNNLRAAMLPSNKSISRHPEPPSAAVASEIAQEVDQPTNSVMSTRVNATDVPASGRFTICLGVPSSPPSDLPGPNPGPSEHHDAQLVILSDHESTHPAQTLGTEETGRTNLHSSVDKVNLTSNSAHDVNHSKAPVLTLPKEFAFTMRSTFPAKPRLKDVRKQAPKNPQATSQKQTVHPSAKVPVDASPRPKQLVRTRTNVCDDDRAAKRPRNNRSTLASPSRPRVGPSRPGVLNRVRTTVKRLNSLSKNAPAVSTMKQNPASHTLACDASLKLSRNPPLPIHNAFSHSRVARQTNGNAQSTSKDTPATSQTHPMAIKDTPIAASNFSQSDDVVTSDMTRGTSQVRRLLMQEIRGWSTGHRSQKTAVVPGPSQSDFRTSSTAREKKSEANHPLVEITENTSRPAHSVGGTRRVLSGASSSRTVSINLTHEARLKNHTDKNAPTTSTGFQNRLNKWREVEAQQSLNSSTQSNKLPEWQDVSLVHHLLPVKDHSKPKKPPIRFGLATEKRMMERENWEQIKANKEKIEAKIKAQEEMKAQELEREEFIKMRRECVIKANPIPEYLKKNR